MRFLAIVPVVVLAVVIFKCMVELVLAAVGAMIVLAMRLR